MISSNQGIFTWEKPWMLFNGKAYCHANQCSAVVLQWYEDAYLLARTRWKTNPIWNGREWILEYTWARRKGETPPPLPPPRPRCLGG